MSGLTRREAMGAAAGAALVLAGCGGAGSPNGAAGLGSTLVSTWADPGGLGQLSRGPGEALIPRTDLGPASGHTRVLATLAHVTDAHVLDASSPARVPFLDRLGPPFQSTFRPQESLTAQVLAGALRSVRALAPDAVIQGGDLIDNDQANELGQALAALRGGRVHPGHYHGVQLPENADPFYYRPDLDAPRHPGLLRAASRPFASPGTNAPTYPVLGDHDILIAGEIPPDATTRGLAVGDQALWELPAGLRLPPGVSLTSTGSPDGPPSPGLVDQFLADALRSPKVRVPADPDRRELSAAEVVARLKTAAPRLATDSPATLDYTVDIGDHVRLIVLDLARRGGGSGGLVRPDQPGWLASQLAGGENRGGGAGGGSGAGGAGGAGGGDGGGGAGGAGGAGRWIVVVSHQPLASSEGGATMLELLDAHPRVIAALAGHTHHNRVTPRPTAAGGYWLIETASLIDYPQQARALQIVATHTGVAIRTWMLDHTFPGDLGTISRELAYLDAQGGRPNGFAGAHADRNVTLYRAEAGKRG